MNDTEKVLLQFCKDVDEQCILNHKSMVMGIEAKEFTMLTTLKLDVTDSVEFCDEKLYINSDTEINIYDIENAEYNNDYDENEYIFVTVNGDIYSFTIIE